MICIKGTEVIEGKPNEQCTGRCMDMSRAECSTEICFNTKIWKPYQFEIRVHKVCHCKGFSKWIQGLFTINVWYMISQDQEYQ